MIRPRPDPRVPLRLPVATPEGGGPAVTKNISMGGLFLITKTRFEVGTDVELVLNIAGMDLAVVARVTHQQADGAGFSFIDPSPLLREIVREQIDAILSQHLTDDTDPGYVMRHSVTWSRDGSGREHADLRDLSVSGAYLESRADVRVGDTIYVYVPGFIATDGDKASEVRGGEAEVVHVGDDGFRVRFRRASAEFRMAVERMLMSMTSTTNPA